MTNISVLGIDLGKSTFHAIGHNQQGRVIFKKQFTRTRLLTFLQQLPVCIVAMESCPSSQWLGRYCQSLGHDTRLLPPQYVKPYVKTNKNDFIDADAIAEAAARPNMRFVPVKSEVQQAQLVSHRLRESFVKQRSACMTQIHAFLLEFGINHGKGHSAVRRLPMLLEQISDQLPSALLPALGQLHQHYLYLCEQIKCLEKRIQQACKHNDDVTRLMATPGIGIHTPTRLVAEVGNAKGFDSGRQIAAWLGLTPRQFSTGGKTTLGGISKRGNRALRALFVHGARSLLRFADKYQHTQLGRWIFSLKAGKPFNVATVALANKLVRIAWAVLSKQQTFKLV